MEQTQSEAQRTMNIGYAAASALQIRLDTKPILDDIELFLRGARLIVEQDAKGQIKCKKVTIGTAKANDLGIQGILNLVTAIINPQVVQGNFTNDLWTDYVVNFHMNLATNIVNNCYNWKILDDDIDLIIDFIMPLVEAFTSRLIDNEERKSYAETIKTFESSSTREGKTGGRIFNNG